MAGTPLMEVTDIRAAINWQADHAAAAFAPCTTRVVRAQLALLDGGTALGARIRDWPRPSLEDALPLRVAAGFHNLFLTGDAAELGAVYAGDETDQHKIDGIVGHLARRFDQRLLPWLDGPPQTNEAGRAASLMAGLLWLGERVGTRFELNEIGASAGVNTMLERYFFDLGGVTVGPPDSPMRIVPEWRGPPPPAVKPAIVRIRGCDIAPVELADPEQALRLKSYVWPDAAARMARIDAAIALAAERRPDLVKADAGAWIAERLAEPQEAGTVRVLYHSIMWQYLPPETRAGIKAAMAAAGARATSERPLGWISLETNRATFRHELRVAYWPGGETPVLLATAHPHGAWVEWGGTP